MSYQAWLAGFPHDDGITCTSNEPFIRDELFGEICIATKKDAE